MELELGLALPSCFPVKNSDLNGNVDIFDDNFSEMKNDISYIQHKSNFSAPNSDYDDSDKFERKTLPLLVWNGQPNDEEEDDHRKRRTFEACYPEFKEENGVVGWPPIKSWRKRKIHGIYNNDVIGRRNSMYVKVKMEGIAIGRKINLRLYNSYQVLTNSLIQMFAKYQSSDENGTRFTLLYQDREGDWMLAGDVPWQTFMETVQRIQILRNGKRGRINSRKSSDIS